MTTIPGDIIFAKNGRPVEIKSKDPKTGEIVAERDMNLIRESAKFGIKNGLNEDRREAYKTVISEVQSDSQQEMINNLYKKIEDLKSSNGDPRLIRYLNGELQFLMSRNNSVPEQYKTDELTLSSF